MISGQSSIKNARLKRRELRQISQCSLVEISDAMRLKCLLKKHSKQSFSRLKDIFGHHRMIVKIEELWEKVAKMPSNKNMFNLAMEYTNMYFKVVNSIYSNIDDVNVDWKFLMLGIILQKRQKKLSEFEREILDKIDSITIFRAFVILLPCISFSFSHLTSFLRNCDIHHDFSQIAFVFLSESFHRVDLDKTLLTIVGIYLLKTLHMGQEYSETNRTMNFMIDVSYKVGSLLCTYCRRYTNSMLHCWIDKFYSGMLLDWTRWETFLKFWSLDDIYLRICSLCGKRPSMNVFERLKMSTLDDVNGKKKISSIAKWIPPYHTRCLWMGNHSLDQLMIDLIFETNSSTVFKALVSESKFYELCVQENLLEEGDYRKTLRKILSCYNHCISKIHLHQQLMAYDDDVIYDEKAFEIQSKKIMETRYDIEKMPICPITNEVPITPVTTFHNRCYERHALLSWIQNSDGRDPLDPSTILSRKDVKFMDLNSFAHAKYD